MDYSVEARHAANGARREFDIKKEVVLNGVIGGQAAFVGNGVDPLDVAAERADNVDAVHAAAEHEVLGHVQTPRRKLVDWPHVVQIEALQGDQPPQFPLLEPPLGIQKLAVKPHRLPDQKFSAGLLAPGRPTSWHPPTW